MQCWQCLGIWSCLQMWWYTKVWKLDTTLDTWTDKHEGCVKQWFKTNIYTVYRLVQFHRSGFEYIILFFSRKCTLFLMGCSVAVVSMLILQKCLERVNKTRLKTLQKICNTQNVVKGANKMFYKFLALCCNF